MSWLFPLYALGALAIAAPILFHLFQRKPHGQQEFSSLMFLQATPPTLTRRSRLSDLLLLLLRGLVLLLLALAFTRPFLRSISLLDLDAPARSVALLIDTSASMRREAMWQQMQQSIDQVVKDLRPADQVTLLSFDREPKTLISFEAWDEAEPSRRIPLLKEQIQGLAPTWHETNLATALIEAGDTLLQQRLVEDHSQPLQVVVFSDLQEGSSLAALQSYDWPEEISVDLRTVTVPVKTNASLQALPPAAGETEASRVRILVRNEPDSVRAQFTLGWKDEAGKPVDVHVPPGQTRTVRITQPRGAQQLELQGDNHAFDNELYLTETTPQQKRLWYMGDDRDDDIQSLYYYLRQATLDTRTQQVVIEKLDDLTSLAIATPKQTPLMVLSKPLSDSARGDLRRYIERGGRVLVVLAKSVELATSGEFLAKLLDLPDVQLGAAEQRDYAMLADIEFGHPVFQPFADPRYSDFTKIHFWTHHRLTSSHEAPWVNLARFDDGFPALVEKQIEQGKVWILTSGWQPDESQLALSSKFVPLLHGFFGRTTEALVTTSAYVVGQPIKLTPKQAETSITAPDGELTALVAMSESFDAADVPGIYNIQQGDELFSVAVNLSPDESRTRTLLPDRLEQLGVQLGEQRTVEAIKKEQRQMRNKELEGRQKLWRWAVLAALIAVALETMLSGRASRSVSVGSKGVS